MSRDRGGPRLDVRGAVELLRQEVPAFGEAVDEHLDDNDGEILFHLLMGELARFYMRCEQDDEPLQRRFWMTVDRLIAHGTDAVGNAVAVSFIEWFAWGGDRERAALVQARPLMSSAVRAVADEFLRER